MRSLDLQKSCKVSLWIFFMVARYWTMICLSVNFVSSYLLFSLLVYLLTYWWSLFRITIISQHDLQLIYLFIYPLYIHLFYIYTYIYICENWIGIVLYIKSLIVILLIDFMNKTCRKVNIVCVSFWLINGFKFIKK